MEKINFRRFTIVGDGSCLFRAISLFLYSNQNSHKDLRVSAVKYVKENWKTLKDFVLTNNEEEVTLREYCKQMNRTSSYGTSVEILAISAIFSLEFRIYSCMQAPGSRFFQANTRLTIISKASSSSSVCVAAHWKSKIWSF